MSWLTAWPEQIWRTLTRRKKVILIAKFAAARVWAVNGPGKPRSAGVPLVQLANLETIGRSLGDGAELCFLV